MDEPFVHLELAAQNENLPLFLEFARSRIQEAGFDEETAGKLVLAVEEILVNAVNYAYPQTTGTLRIMFGNRNKNALMIEITDSGVPFNPLTVPEADTRSSLDDRKIGGLGIFFMRSVVDEAHYRRENGRNILTLVKYFHNRPID